MKKNKGISLISLIVTIIIIIILSGAIIISMLNDNPIGSANEAHVKLDLRSILEEVAIYNVTALANGQSELFPTDNNGKLDHNIITSLDDYADKVAVINNELYYIGEDELEKKWAKEVGYKIYDGELTPVENEITQISAGGYFSLILYKDSTVRSFGRNWDSELGRTNIKPDNVPEYVMRTSSMPLYNVRKVTAGYDNALAILKDDTVVGWGDNYEGSLGWSLGSDVTKATIINGLTPAKDIALGSTISYSIKDDNSITSTGDFYYDFDTTLINNVKQISCNYYSGLAVLNDGTAKGWGYNVSGEMPLLGSSYDDDSGKYKPVDVVGISNIKQVELSNENSFYLLENKTVVAYGNNNYGELGNGTTNDSDVPVTVNGLTNVKSISSKGDHVLALLEDGSVMAWGNNEYGQLGDGTTNISLVPKKIEGLSNVVQIAAGYYHSLALLADGTLMAWGSNEYGQLGDGTYEDKNVPTAINANFPSIPEPVYTPPDGYWSKSVPGDTVKINFFSDSSVNGEGFKIGKIKYVMNGNTIEERLTDAIQILNYSDNLNENFIITRPGATSITVNFEIFSTEQGYDGVVLSDKFDNIIETLTGSEYIPTE